jgi:ABC-2 type transport system permease protein
MKLFWVPHVLSLELKKAFSYRVAFWMQFFFMSGTEIVVAYLVWHAVFASAGVTVMEGYTFHGLVLYNLFSSFAVKITRGAEYGYISQEIYDGGLTRYLLYPLPFFPYKYVVHIGQQIMGVVQLLIALTIYGFVIRNWGGQAISVGSVLAGVVTCFISGYLHFLIASCLELVAFWQDIIWNIMVMLRFSMNLLGGAMIPLVFFPEWGQKIVRYTPFPALASFPTRTFLGQVDLHEWLSNVGTIAVWAVIFTSLLNGVWSRGSKQYSGVGV